MLEQVRRDHGEARLSLVDDDLAGVVRSVAEQFEALATERQINLVVETPDELPSRFDPERMSRVVSNLLANALRFTPPGRNRPHARSPSSGACARLEVADSGVGVPAEQRAILFERFRTADNGRGRRRRGPGPRDRAGVRAAARRRPSSSARRPRAARCSPCSLPREPAASEPAPMRLSQQLAAARRTALRQGAPGGRAGRQRAAAARGARASRRCCSSTATPTAPPSLADALETRAGVFTASEATEALRLATDLQPDMVVDRRPRRRHAPPPHCWTAWPASGGWRASCASRSSQRGGDPSVRTALLESGAQDFIAEPAGRGGAARPLRPAARARRAAPPRGGRRSRAPAAARRHHSTVTVFARLRGWSTFRPRRRAIR